MTENLFARDQISVPISVSGEVHAFILASDGTFHDLNADGLIDAVSAPSDLFALITNGVWVALTGVPPADLSSNTASINNRSIGNVSSMNGEFLTEDQSFRTGGYDPYAGTEFDRLRYSETRPNIYLQPDTKRGFSFSSQILNLAPISYQVTSQTGYNGIDISTVGNKMVVHSHSDAQRNKKFDLNIFVPEQESSDNIAFNLRGKILLGTHYIVRGYMEEAELGLDRKLLFGSTEYIDSLIEDGQEPHVISSNWSSDFRRPRNDAFYSYDDLKGAFGIDRNKLGADYQGILPLEITSCMDGSPYSYPEPGDNT